MCHRILVLKIIERFAFKLINYLFSLLIYIMLRIPYTRRKLSGILINYFEILFIMY